MAPAVAARTAGTVRFGARVLLLVGAIALLAGVWRSVWAAIGEGGVLAILVFIVAGLAVGHVLGGRSARSPRCWRSPPRAAIRQSRSRSPRPTFPKSASEGPSSSTCS